ncbi:hypothetical protein R1sor_016053 [Riccia sorocarpa]|uniref:Uncharacterized protein n=1 Tax=Riccia sorocarpa TaxID=122646 RepID=A0ABD3HH24_9MARC
MSLDDLKERAASYRFTHQFVIWSSEDVARIAGRPLWKRPARRWRMSEAQPRIELLHRGVVTDESAEVTDFLHRIDEELVSALKGVHLIVYRGSTAKAISAWNAFESEWYEYVDQHPVLKGQLDPVYVIAQDVAAVPAGGWPVVPVHAETAMPVEVNDSSSVWSFQNTRDAQYWCGLVSQAHPDQRLLLIDAGVKPAKIL